MIRSKVTKTFEGTYRQKLSRNKMGCFNDPAWKVCGWWGGGVVVGWLTPTNYIQLAGAGSISLYPNEFKNKTVFKNVRLSSK